MVVCVRDYFYETSLFSRTLCQGNPYADNRLVSSFSLMRNCGLMETSKNLLKKCKRRKK